MKYTIETTKDGCIEVLEFHDGSKYMKKHIKTPYGSKCEDKDFSDQMEADGICEEILERVSVFDSFLASEFLDIAELDC
jgi:hypothetical protein